MTELHVRNVPPDLHERLRARARGEGRSVSAEVIAILRNALEEQDSRERRASAIARLRRFRERNPLPPGAPLAEDLIREDREAR